MRYYCTWLYGTDPRALELPPVFLDSRIQQKLTTREVNRRQAEWNDAGYRYPMAWQGPDLYIRLQVPAGSFVMSVYAINNDGETRSIRSMRDVEMVVKSGSDDATLENLADFNALPTLTTSRIHDFWSGVYKRFFVRGPCNVLMQVRRNYSDIVKLSGLMLDPTDECPAPYFQTEQQWQQLQAERTQRDHFLRADFVNKPAVRAARFAPRSSEADAAAAILSRLDEMQAWNPQWWAMNHRRVGVLLARWYQAQGTLAGPMLTCRTTALYYAGMYSVWEAGQTAQGLRTARDIEQSLRYDGHSDYSGRGLATVEHYLNPEQTRPATQP